jgi:hypothetical protein
VASIASRCDGVEQTVTHDEDAWTMRAPAGFVADNASILALIDGVTRAKVESWVADADDGRFGLGSCSLSLTLRVDGGERVARVELGREGEGGVYARTADSPAVFVAPASMRDLARTLLVDLHGLALPEVASVKLDRDGKHLTYEADAGADEAGSAVIDAAAVLRADAVAHLGPAHADEGLGSPSLVVTLRSGAASKRIVFGSEAHDGKSRFARVDGTDATFTVGSDRVKAFYGRF